MQPHPYPNRFGEEGARRARRSPVSLAREVLANMVSPNCHSRRPALGGSALSPRTHESGRPGSNRRRPAWEAFWALAGQGFFGGGSRNGITEYCRDPVLFDNFAVRPLAGWLVFAARDRSRRPRSQTPTAGVAVRPAAYPASGPLIGFRPHLSAVEKRLAASRPRAPPDRFRVSFADPLVGNCTLTRPAPLLLVLDDLLGARVLDLLVRGNRKVAHVLHDLVVERRVVLERLGHGDLLEDRVPRALGLAGAAVDAFVGVDVELVRLLLPVGARVLVDAVDGADGHAPGIYAVATEACDDVSHVPVLPKPNTSGNGSGLRGAWISAPKVYGMPPASSPPKASEVEGLDARSAVASGAGTCRGTYHNNHTSPRTPTPQW